MSNVCRSLLLLSWAASPPNSHSLSAFAEEIGPCSFGAVSLTEDVTEAGVGFNVVDHVEDTRGLDCPDEQGGRHQDHQEHVGCMCLEIVGCSPHDGGTCAGRPHAGHPGVRPACVGEHA